MTEMWTTRLRITSKRSISSQSACRRKTIWATRWRGSGGSNEAVEHLEAAARISPDSSTIHNNLAVTLADLGRFSDAAAHFQRAIELEPEYAKAVFQFGKALAKLDRMTEAIASAQQGLELARQAKQDALAAQIEAWLKTTGR